jgi:hypothetical protein
MPLLSCARDDTPILAGPGDGFQLLPRTEFRQMTEFDYCAADCWIFKNRVAVFLIRSRVAVTLTAEQWRTSLMSCCSSTLASRGCYDRSPERQGHACGIRVLRLRTGNPGIRMPSAAVASAASRRPARPRRQPRRKGRRSTGTRTCDAIGYRPRAVEARGGVSVATRTARRVCVADRRGPSHRGGGVWRPCSGACFGRLKPGFGREQGGPPRLRAEQRQALMRWSPAASAGVDGI